MSKIYEALQHTHMQKKGKKVTTSNLPVTFDALGSPDMGFEDEMLSLYKILDTLLPGARSKIVQFIGSREGEGVSTIVREFARVSADLIGRSVLLLDGDRHHQTQSYFFEFQNTYGWIDAIKNGELIANAVHQVGESRLFLSPSSNSSVFTPEIFNSPEFNGFCQDMKTGYDLVLIDSAPLSVSADGLAIASKVDGVILIVEAEKTRWQTARRVKESIARVGGNVLGVVLNKRRYYIPQRIYKFL